MIWTRVAGSIAYNDNHYTTGICAYFVCVKEWEREMEKERERESGVEKYTENERGEWIKRGK